MPATGREALVRIRAMLRVLMLVDVAVAAAFALWSPARDPNAPAATILLGTLFVLFIAVQVIAVAWCSGIAGNALESTPRKVSAHRRVTV